MIDKVVKTQFLAVECHAKRNSLAVTNVLEFAMRVDVVIVKSLFNSSVDVELFKERLNVIKQRKLKKLSFVIMFAKRKRIVEYMFVIQNAVHLKVFQVPKDTFAN